MYITYQILNIILCIWMAKKDAEKILTDKPVNHWLNGLIHIAVASLAFYLYDWRIAIAVLIECRLFFDMALNTFRHLNLFYVPSKPKSIIDQIEKKIFGRNGWLPKFIYLKLAITLNIWSSLT